MHFKVPKPKESQTERNRTESPQGSFQLSSVADTLPGGFQAQEALLSAKQVAGRVQLRDPLAAGGMAKPSPSSSADTVTAESPMW